jgi:hypothetical protein
MKNKITIPMTNEDINKIFPGVRIIPYPKLKEFRNIDELTDNVYNACFILYINEQAGNTISGHWNLLIKDDDVVYLFDPYGGYIDENLVILGPSRSDFNESEALLSNMLINDRRVNKVVYNDFCYQQEKEGVKTCGRHCSFRLQCFINGIKTEKQYKKFIDEIKKRFNFKNYDDLIVKLII